MAAKQWKMYKFVVDCNANCCNEVQQHMSQLKFRVEIEDTWLGDHYGLKKFETKAKAEVAATKLFEECSDKLNQITITQLKG